MFNFSKSYLNQKVEAVTLKAGYLLCNKICCAGSTCYEINYDAKNSGVSLFDKLEFLRHTSQHQPTFQKEVISIRALMKRTSTAGCVRTEQMVKRKEGESLINMTYDAFSEAYLKNIEIFGLQALRELCNDDNFCQYPMNNNPEDSTGDKITASDLLQRLLSTSNENEKPEIFLLDADFLSEEYDKPDLYQVTDDEAADRDTIYLHHCFTLCGINNLTSDELRTIRHEIKPEESVFSKKVNQWIDMCYFDNAVPDPLTFFKDYILLSSADLQQKIDNNSTLKNHVCLQENALKTEVWLGEMPVLKIMELS